ncbi:MAG TPA: alpha/beta fold hydrolase [Gemmata sp.]|jgi:homoserine O-acetyltransferase|nr:alpha/beta fold hydrolase [Gemmata sp.]
MRSMIVAIVVLIGGTVAAADFPKPVEADAVLKDFRFVSGETMDVRLHYRTLGKPKRDKDGKIDNAILILHATGGSGANFVSEGNPARNFGGELFGKGQPLDAEQFFIIIPDSIGHGQSFKPSDGLHARFPRYGYRDMLDAQHRLVTDILKVDHLRLVMGTSMGGMHTWLWGQTYPDFMDALLPLASLPTQISGRNRLWRKMVSESIRMDPDWKDGEYKTQPHGLRFAAQMLQLMGSSAVVRQKQAPTSKAAEEFFEKELTAMLSRTDANDLLYAVESSKDYDPGSGLSKIKAQLLAINFADDLINPPELGILEREINKVKNGKALLIPASDETVGHGTHTKAAVWKVHLETLMKETAK